MRDRKKVLITPIPNHPIESMGALQMAARSGKLNSNGIKKKMPFCHSPKCGKEMEFPYGHGKKFLSTSKF
jgi:hypothetical protein